MKRKVNRVGQNTLTVSLPAKWVKKTNIKAGDELEIKEEGKTLTITNKETKKGLKRVTLTLDKFNHQMLNRHLSEFYRLGVEEITLKFNKDTFPNYKKGKQVRIDKYIKKVIDRFIGMEIISQTDNSIILQSLITKEESEKITPILNRTYFLIKEFLNEFIESIDKDFKKFYDRSYDYHDNITKFSAYYLRLLNFSDLSETKKTRMFGLLEMIDKITDKVRHTCERVNEMKKSTKKIKKYLEEIFSIFLEQFNLILKKNQSIEYIDDLVKRRYKIVNRINKEKFNDEELRVISECKIFLDTINEFSETNVALNIDKYMQGAYEINNL